MGVSFKMIYNSYQNTALFTLLLLLLGVRPEECSSDGCGNEKIVLNNGVSMPIVGLGTAGYTDQDLITHTLSTAIRAGYRLIDTADLYSNHQQIAAALGVIHSPTVPPILSMGPGPEQERQLRIETWQCLQELYEEGVVKAIGVSNYDEELIKEVLDIGGTVPQVNQVYMTPFHPQTELFKYCTSKGIHMQAYSSLGSSSHSKILNNNIVHGVAEKYSVSPAQLLLKWNIQKGWSVLPKSRNPAHLAENLDLNFIIDKKSMRKISSLSSTCLKL